MTDWVAPSKSIQLEANRIYLRPAKRGDFKAWRNVRERSREHLQPWEPKWQADTNSRWAWGVRLRAWRENWSAGRTFAFLIWQAKTHQLLGGVALSNIRRGASQTGTLGYWLDVEAVGHGYMLEAVSRVIDFARTDLQLARLDASTLPENARSRRILETCGFAEEGEAEAFLQIAGDRRKHVLYGLNLLASPAI